MLLLKDRREEGSLGKLLWSCPRLVMNHSEQGNYKFSVKTTAVSVKERISPHFGFLPCPEHAMGCMMHNKAQNISHL